MQFAWTHRGASIVVFITAAIVFGVTGFLGRVAGQGDVKETVLLNNGSFYVRHYSVPARQEEMHTDNAPGDEVIIQLTPADVEFQDDKGKSTGGRGKVWFKARGVRHAFTIRQPVELLVIGSPAANAAK